MDNSRKTVLKGIFAGVLLAVLLSGLALVVRSLRNTELSLDLDLKKDDSRKKRY